MIAWTTPTVPVTINTALLESNRCKVYGTFSQGKKRVTIEPTSMEVDSTNGKTTLYFDLTQLQTAKFRVGEVKVQVNFIDWMGYRDATKTESVYIGSNALESELDNGR